MKKAHITARQALQLERQEQALRWRIDERLTFTEIGARFGVTEVSAIAYVNKALARRSDKVIAAASKYRGIQAYRLENLLNAHEAKALEGNVKATEVYLKILDQLNKLYGLYPQQDNSANGSAVSIHVTYTNDNRQITITPAAVVDHTSAPGNRLLDTDTDTPTLVYGKVTAVQDTDTDG